jgi:hypothetical protein
MENNTWNLEIDKKYLTTQMMERFKCVPSLYKHELLCLFDIYLPFWQVIQDVYFETEMEMSKFTKILLELIKNGIKSHSDICSFLGIEEDDFCVMQLRFMEEICGFIWKIEKGCYEITPNGWLFLENKTKKQLKAMGKDEFEFMMTGKEGKTYHENDMTEDFFDPKRPFDEKKYSEEKNNKFSGYKIMAWPKDKEDLERKNIIEHENQPTRDKLVERQSDFAIFYKRHQDKKDNDDKIKTFYDFGRRKPYTDKKYICFLACLYVNKDNMGDLEIRIHQSADSVKKFNREWEYELEETLSNQVTKYAIENLEKLGLQSLWSENPAK